MTMFRPLARMSPLDARWGPLLALFSLALLTMGIYAKTGAYPFTSFDDPFYILENPHVAKGLSWETLTWAFSIEDKKGAYWHPLTWLSHALDVSLFGLRAGAHQVNAGIHTLNVLLLFLLLKRTTGAPWRALLVSAMFAAHPLNVDAVAWVSQRKAVLSACFFLLGLSAYVSYVRRPTLPRYGLSFLCFLCGLLAKPTLTTFPLLLLVFDCWPLRRFAGAQDLFKPSFRRILLEKVPFMFLSLLVGILVFLSQEHYANVLSFDRVPLGLRLANALVSVLGYLKRIFVPMDLAVFYPYPEKVPLWEWGLAGLGLAAILLAAWKGAGRRPHCLLGIGWFLITLIPVLGFMQVGLWPALADRWAYVPMIGILIAVIWEAGDLASRTRHGPKMAIGLGLVSICVLCLLTARQIATWKDPISLFNHAIAVTGPTYIAHNNLGNAFFRQGDGERARYHYMEALGLEPRSPDVQCNAGLMALEYGDLQKASLHLLNALRLDPANWQVHANLAVLRSREGHRQEAVYHYRTLLDLRPDHAKAHNNLGVLLAQMERLEEAREHFEKALALDPQYEDAASNLERVLDLLRQDGRAPETGGRP